MSKPSRLIKPSKQSRKDPPGDRSHMLLIGERLMRAGSEGNLVRPRPSQKPGATSSESFKPANSAKRNQELCSQEEVNNDHSSKHSSTDESESDPWSPRTVPRRHTVGGPRSAEDVITMRSYNMDHKKEAFLELLKQKYPHHAAVIMGHQERLRDQIRSSGPTVSPQSLVGEPGEHMLLASLESLEAMAEGEALSAFTRGSRYRASLPVVKSNNQTKDRSLGFIYLQYGEETKKIQMPNEVSSTDTIRALFVSAFPQQLSMKMLESPKVAIFIKDDMRNMYYELTDVRNIAPNSFLKVYHKDPAQAFSHNTRANNGDVRITRERLYGTRQQQGGQSPVHTLPHSPIHHSVHGSMSPPTPRSMPSSPSRISYGHSVSMPGGATLPRDRLSSMPPSRAITPCSSAILERRDVKPDEDMSTKSIPQYAEGYSSPEARLSIATSQSSHAGDVPDGTGYVQHRSSVKYTDGQDLQHPLYRQKSRKYSESQLTSMAPKSPPVSPHRVNEVRMIEILPAHNSHVPGQMLGVERGSPVRRSIRKDSNGGTIEKAGRVRDNVASPVFVDLPPVHGERPFQGHVPAGDHQSERIKAMEQQIASLTGLVQHALMKGPNSTVIETSRESAVRMGHPTQNGGVSVVASIDRVLESECSSVDLQPSVRDAALCSVLSTFRRNVSDLRLQLHQLKQMQLQNQEWVRLMLQQAEEEIAEKFSESIFHHDDSIHRKRVQMEEERLRYQSMEEKLLLQLGELENYVEMLKKESSSPVSQRPVTLKDVEEGAVNLRQVGEALAKLKGEFPGLQIRMRGVLRAEVEAVRFLKDEPHKMDSMLKRVKALTDTLSRLRRSVTESHNHTESVFLVEEHKSPKLVHNSPTPQPKSPVKIICSEPGSSSPKLVHRVVIGTTSTHHTAPLTPTHNKDSPTVAKVSPRSREHSPALQKRAAPQGQEAGCSTTPGATEQVSEISSCRSKTEEVSNQHVVENETEREMNRILQQTQASLMQAIPDLDVLGESTKGPSQTPHVSLDELDSLLPVPHALEAAPQEGLMPDKPVQASLDRPQKATIEKPHRASTDKPKPNPETQSKSPPPPPPRRFYPAGTGLTTGRSGEVIYNSRKESTSAQEGEEEAPQQKPVRVAPEVKPKPRIPPLVNTSSSQEEDAEGDKMMAELQNSSPVSRGAPSDSKEESDSPVSPGVFFITQTSNTPTPSTSSPEDPKEKKDLERNSPSKVSTETTSDLSQSQKWSTSDDLSVITHQSLHAEKEVQRKRVNSLKDNAKIGTEPKIECPLKPLQHVSPTEGKVPCSSSPISPDRVKSIKHHKTTVQVTFVGLKTQSDESHLQASDTSCSTALKEHEPKQEVTRRSAKDQVTFSEDASLSPDLPGEEGPPPPNNIAFRITKTKVQALSTGEYHQLVTSKGTDVQTVKVGSEPAASTPEDSGTDRKPVIIIFDEPMDIHQAYKRLSTIFECEEEMERVLSEERIDEENEEEIETSQEGLQTPENSIQNRWRTENRLNSQRGSSEPLDHQGSFERCVLDLEEDKMGSSKDAKKKFKFKFPKKQLVAISQALRSGTKTGKKTLQVVVYEDAEELDGTVTELKEAEKSEIRSHEDSDVSIPKSTSEVHTNTSQSTKDRTEELRKTTYKTLDSLEQTIKQLESTISDIGPTLVSEVSRKESRAKRIGNHTDKEEGSPTKRATHLKAKPSKSSLQRRSKTHSRTSSSISTSSSSSNSKQISADSHTSSRISSPKSRHQPGNVEKPGKNPKMQDSQRQFAQANGSAMKAGGNSKHAFPASKIPAFIPSSWKHSSTRAPRSNVSNHANQSSSSKSSIPCLSLSWPSCRLVSPSTEGQSLTLLPQTQNNLSCSYSCSSSSSSGSYSSSSSVSPTSTSSSSSPSSPSLLSPTAMCRGGRALPMPSFSSRKSLRATSTPTAFTRDMA